MTVWETLLVFGVLPVAGFGLLALLVYGPSLAGTARYRPGRAWDHDPVWYIARPDLAAAAGSHAAREALEERAQHALPERAEGHREPPASVLGAPIRTARGGASGEW